MPETSARCRAGAVFLALTLGLAPAGPSQAEDPGGARQLIAKAAADLAKGDGIAAEVRLKQAQTLGAARADLAALMGEALLDQGKADRAREWLAPAGFSAATAARGWRNLGRLERAAGNLPASSLAYDRALRSAPNDGGTWVEVAYLRFALGNHLDGIDAAARALELDPTNPRALEAKGSIVRDQYGLAAALPWYEAALKSAPDDFALMGAYAATLGELGRAREMLVVTRKMLAADGRNAQAFYLQAALAARAGDVGTARSMLTKGGKPLAAMPGAMLLSAALDRAAGNPQAAITTLRTLLERQPGNQRADELLAGAMLAAGNHAEIVARYRDISADPAASPYLLTVVARALEARGDRAGAAPLLDRAARDYSRPIVAVRGNPIGILLAQGRADAAAGRASAALAASPANAAAAAIAGDVAFAQGLADEAAGHYAQSARVRLSDGLLVKYAVALEVAGRGGEAAGLVDRYLAQSPSSRPALWLAGGIARQHGDWNRATTLLTAYRDNGGAGDINAALALADAQMRSGQVEAAVATARAAYRLQPASGYAAGVYGAALARAGQGAAAKAMLVKSRAMAGEYGALPPVRYAFASPR